MSVIRISRLNNDDKKVFMVGKAGVGLQVNEDEALYVAKTLALLLGFNVVERAKVGLEYKQTNANQNSTKEYPLGKEHS